jgi:hypothetical protein
MESLMMGLGGGIIGGIFAGIMEGKIFLVMLLEFCLV